jgi:hypothetical protein
MYAAALGVPCVLHGSRCLLHLIEVTCCTTDVIAASLCTFVVHFRHANLCCRRQTSGCGLDVLPTRVLAQRTLSSCLSNDGLHIQQKTRSRLGHTHSSLWPPKPPQRLAIAPQEIIQVATYNPSHQTHSGLALPLLFLNSSTFLLSSSNPLTRSFASSFFFSRTWKR